MTLSSPHEFAAIVFIDTASGFNWVGCHGDIGEIKDLLIIKLN